MKLTYFQLTTHLATKLSSIYMVSGDELFLKQDAINQLRKAAKKAGFNERVRMAPEAGFDWEQLYTQLHSSSMFAEKQIIELDFRDHSPNKTAASILQTYAEKPSDQHLLILDLSKIDDKISRTAWYKALEKIAVHVAIWPIPREQLPAWLIQRAKKYKLQLDPAAANLLADYVEGNLVAAAQIMEKMYLLKIPTVIDSETVKTILTDESRFTVFDLIEQISAGNKIRALHILESLQQESTEPVLVLWALTRELRQMAAMATQLKQGSSYETLFQKYRIFARRQAGIRRFLSTYTADDCTHSLIQAAEIDKIIKGIARGNVWDALELFCLRII